MKFWTWIFLQLAAASDGQEHDVTVLVHGLGLRVCLGARQPWLGFGFRV